MKPSTRFSIEAFEKISLVNRPFVGLVNRRHRKRSNLHEQTSHTDIHSTLVTAIKMVKVLENRVVDIDVLPGTKEDQLKAQADQIAYVSQPKTTLSYKRA